jgi:hypothetical protein
MKRIFLALLVVLLFTAVDLPAQNSVTGAMMLRNTNVIKTKKKLKEAPIKKGYQSEFSIAYSFFDYGKDAGSMFNFNYIGGYRFSNLFFLGAGIGINFNYFYDESDSGYPNAYDDYSSGTFGVSHNLISIPLYLHARLYFTNTRCQPFFAFSIGGHLTGSKEVDNAPDVSYNPSCFFVNPVFGLNFRTNSNYDFYVSTGLMARELLIEGAWYNYGQDVTLYRGFGLAWSLSLGVTF